MGDSQRQKQFSILTQRIEPHYRHKSQAGADYDKIDVSGQISEPVPATVFTCGQGVRFSHVCNAKSGSTSIAVTLPDGPTSSAKIAE